MNKLKVLWDECEFLLDETSQDRCLEDDDPKDVDL